jgi:2-polyprenyl-3-methyl-5-hydroxy-6-metoxy-1,4-benzoquinol methylase
MKTIGYDKDEIKDKFDDFYKDGKSSWSFDINDSLYKIKKSVIKPFIEKSNNILDLGCAEGNFLSSIASSDKKAVGVDISQTAIDLAQEKNFYSELYVGYIDETNKYTKNINNYDLIILNEVLYYVDDFIDTLNSILKLSGKYIFISLAMGPQFFNTQDTDKIEKLLEKYNYKMRKKEVYDMSYKFGIPLRYWTKAYEIFRGIKLKHTHKYIYIRKNLEFMV